VLYIIIVIYFTSTTTKNFGK